MNMNNLSQWLTLTANLGVLIGIAVVAVELHQNQVGMEAEASTLRAQMAMEMGEIRERRGIELEKLILSGEEPSEEFELLNRLHWDKTVRYFENLHYQRLIGVINDEIWQANLVGIESLCSESFREFRPDFHSDRPSESFPVRASFVELVRSVCEK